MGIDGAVFGSFSHGTATENVRSGGQVEQHLGEKTSRIAVHFLSQSFGYIVGHGGNTSEPSSRKPTPTSPCSRMATTSVASALGSCSCGAVAMTRRIPVRRAQPNGTSVRAKSMGRRMTLPNHRSQRGRRPPPPVKSVDKVPMKSCPAP